MKKGLIIYCINEKERNIFFINKCLQEFKKANIDLRYIDEEEVINYLNNNSVNFAIYRGRNEKLIKDLENKKIRVFNNYLTNKTANDKYLSYLLFKDLKLKAITSYLDKEELSFPYVIKSRNGHGGQEVFLINKEDDLKVVNTLNKSFIYQRYIVNKGDVRLYILNKKFIAAVKRFNPHDFHSNYSLGGEVSLFNPCQEMIEDAIKIARYLNSDYIGVDFLINEDSYLINEIEDPVGARMLYQVSDIDIVSLFCQFIIKSI